MGRLGGMADPEDDEGDGAGATQGMLFLSGCKFLTGQGKFNALLTELMNLNFIR
jgi:hypothetical protein